MDLEKIVSANNSEIGIYIFVFSFWNLLRKSFVHKYVLDTPFRTRKHVPGCQDVFFVKIRPEILG